MRLFSEGTTLNLNTDKLAGLPQITIETRFQVYWQQYPPYSYMSYYDKTLYTKINQMEQKTPVQGGVGVKRKPAKKKKKERKVHFKK